MEKGKHKSEKNESDKWKIKNKNFKLYFKNNINVCNQMQTTG